MPVRFLIPRALAYDPAGTVHRMHHYGDGYPFPDCGAPTREDESLWRVPIPGKDRPCWRCFGNPWKRELRNSPGGVDPDVWSEALHKEYGHEAES